MENYIYGPVPSRRLGRSLGVDLIPCKICTYDCIYCQLQKSSSKTLKRGSYRPMDAVLTQLWEKLDQGTAPDCITLAGSGEPTLNRDIGTIITRIRDRTSIPVAVLTNGSLLWEPSVKDAVMAADIVIPSLDAYTPEMFQAINRPHSGIDFQTMTRGLVDFARAYTGTLWLEIFIMDGINGAAADAEHFLPLVRDINPRHLYINTAVRPAADPSVIKAPDEAIDRFYGILGRPRQADVNQRHSAKNTEHTDTAGEILAMTARRPVTITDIAAGLSISQETATRHINDLLANNAVEMVETDAFTYYRKISG
ncbi:MAG: radical SAM protein [Thermodesulfobacteriota bacterium]|nr:radical SAM protein [Thermodesulfobacteriota bacterium]